MAFLAVKKLSTLLRGIISKNNGEYIGINCLHSLKKENNFKVHGNVCKN